MAARIRSSRRLEHEAKRNVELLWLLEMQAPDFKTIADFRKNNKKAIKLIFKDLVRLLKEWELFGKETIAVDGTKLKASNSKKNNFSKKKLERHKKYIDEKIERYLEELDQNDELEKEDRRPTAEELNKRIEELKKRKIRFENLEKELQTSAQQGRSIYRSIDQSFLDSIDLKSQEDLAKYKQRQMIVEHPFGTIKHWWDGGYFLTRGLKNVSTETALTYTAYNFKRVVNILGVEEMVRRLKEGGIPVPA